MDDDIEYQLPQLFAQAAERPEPPVEEILAASTALGRRSRRRRTAGAAWAAVGVLGLTAGAVIGVQRLGIGGAAGGPGPAVAGGAAHRTVTGSAPTGSARPPTADRSKPSAASALGMSSSPVAVVSTGAQTGAALLTRLLAAYGLQKVGEQADPIGVADLVYDDGHGRSDIFVSVQRYTAQMAASQAFTCADFTATDAVARPSGAPEPGCTRTRTAGGQTEYLVVTPDDGAGFYDYQVNLFTSNGLVVSLDAGNGVPHATSVEVTRAAPPLSLAAMQAVVADPGWPGYRDAD